VTGTTILLIGTGLMKIGISVASGANTPAFGKPLTLGLAALMIVLILVISRFATGFVRALSLFITMVIGYFISAALGLLNFQSVADAGWLAIPQPFPYGGLAWPPLVGLIAVIVCFFATAVETTAHARVCRITGVPAESWRIRGAVSNDGSARCRAVRRDGAHVLLAEHRRHLDHRRGQPLRGRGRGLFLVVMAMVPKVGAIIALMPAAVLGGVLLFMFGMVASVGIDIIGSNMRARRDAIIVAASLAVGLGIQAAPPGAFDAVPQALRILVTDGIVMGILLAMFLNIVMPKTDQK
jgi:xanthine permease